jgi:hypothetical protein
MDGATPPDAPTKAGVNGICSKGPPPDPLETGVVFEISWSQILMTPPDVVFADCVTTTFLKI